MNKKILVLLMLLMPIDAFAPGAAMLREFGGRPFNIVLGLIVFSSLLLLPGEWLRFKWRKFEFFALVAILGGLCISTLYFLSTQVGATSVLDLQRTPAYSFVSQFFVFGASILFLLFLRRFFELCNFPIVEAIPSIALGIGTVHLFFFAVHAGGLNGMVLPGFIDLLEWIRPDPGIMRPFGLMSEPSYWGAFVAYMWPLLFLGFRPNSAYRWPARLMALVLIAAAVYIGARTLLGIIFIQALVCVLASGLGRALKALLLLLCALLGMIVFLVTTDVFSVADNLSSAMRLGSTLLGVNVAGTHGLTGVGVGQFHYYYKPEYAPDFLLLSSEAANIFEDVSDFRASTFNFYVRLCVELGVLGLAGYVCLLAAAARNFLHLHDRRLRASLGLAFVGALGFWLTQDSYLYSPAILLTALGLSLGKKASARRGPAADATGKAPDVVVGAA